MTREKKNGIIISWGRAIKRSSTIASELELEEVNLLNSYSHLIMKIWGYIKNFYLTINLIRHSTNGLVIIVAPPTLSIYAGFLGTILNKKVKIVYDFHNGVLRKEWRLLPFLKLILRNSTVISHNPFVKQEVDSAFQTDSVVIGDLLIDEEKVQSYIKCSHNFSAPFLSSIKKNIFVPLSYASDEPLKYLYEVIKENTDKHFILSGKTPSRFQYFSKLKNCSFSGFLNDKDYHVVIASSDAVLCITKDENIQMCAIIESISFGKVTICFDYPINQLLFGNYPNLRYISRSECLLTENITDEFVAYDDLCSYRHYFNSEARNKLNNLRKGI